MKSKPRPFRMPSIREVTSVLREVAGDIEEECEIRLQVYEDGQWTIRVGSSSYDQDHRGYWGAGYLPGRRFDATSLARDLIVQAREQAHDYGEVVDY